jgi:hypothetical protein
VTTPPPTTNYILIVPKDSSPFTSLVTTLLQNIVNLEYYLWFYL